jgi:hydrogenase expression/formation protein HypC
MCQAIPRRVLQVEANRLEVDYDGQPRWVEAHGLPAIAVGDYVVVYAGQALERLDTQEAEEMLAWFADLDAMLEEAAG